MNAIHLLIFRERELEFDLEAGGGTHPHFLVLKNSVQHQLRLPFQ